ncbi:hemicentin-1-like isoform X2 [Dreissena polymorpha]|uniref:hemicentin-1-like isoform X2 n=1 Tax=Dreissena polymorpha TaxID=45954 RepID=UPI002263DE01|nr:hemicentin-1-like isoform X2 [Dreissena polymorpha]
MESAWVVLFWIVAYGVKSKVQNAAPVFSKPQTNDQQTSCFENIGLSLSIYRVSASDADGDTVTVGFHSQNPPEPPFQLTKAIIGWNLMTPASTTIDRETTPTFRFVFSATDGTNTVQSVELTLILTDQNDNSPQFTATSYSASVYDTASAEGNVAGTFSIASETGELKLDTPGNLNSATTATYSLTVEVSDGTNTNATTVTIHVLVTPTVPEVTYDGRVIDSKVLNVIYKRSIELMCKSYDKPTPSIYWLDCHNAFVHSTTLKITDPTSGIYTCVAVKRMQPSYDQFIRGQSEKYIPVYVLLPPTEPILSMDGSRVDNTTLSIMSGNNVSIECASDGYPSPTVRWEHGFNIYNGSFLNLTNIKETDAGTYMCVVENTMNPTFGLETIGRSNLSLQLIVQTARSGYSHNLDPRLPLARSGYSHNLDPRLPLIGSGCGTLLLLAATVLVCLCRKRKMLENSGAKKRFVELQARKGKQRKEDFDENVENPMYISADDVLAYEPSESQDDVVENPMCISAEDIGQKKVAKQANAKSQVGQTKIYSIRYDVHKVDTVVYGEDNHYAEIIH